MTQAVFDRALARTIEFDEVAKARFGARTKVNLCGLGEPLLNRHTPDFVGKVRDAGFEISLSTNGSLLDERRSAALLEGGLQGVEINMGEEGDDYEQIYGLPFERSCDNIARFAEMARSAGGDCQVRVVLVNHRRDPDHLEKMKAFWRERGIDQFLPFNVMNRAGTLFVDEMQYATFAERAEAEALLRARDVHPVCPAPFLLLFIGYDGQYYLCCSDWKKEVALGSVFETSFMAIMGAKLEHVTTRQPICKSCNHDPVNRLTDALRGGADDDADDQGIDHLLEELIEHDHVSRKVVRELEDFAPTGNEPDKRARRLIPVTIESDRAI
jgi:MoaA/NifB/PqqE/SkfB family radical SAM enzyme